MCAILGVVHPTGKPVDVVRFTRQLDTMAHRGPDGWGVMVADRVSGACEVGYNRPPQAEFTTVDLALGHRRLAILDLSAAAAQPMRDAGGRQWVTFNGEIYNFRQLRQDLEARGWRFRTDHSDTEALLYAFREWGEGCVDHLRGMFAFAVADLEAGSLFLARDRLGKKPLYYRAAPEAFQFASELKAIVADPDVPRRLDPVALAQYLMYNYVPAPRTIYEGVHKLPPAHYAWVDLNHPDRVTTRQYWELQYRPGEIRRLEDWVEQLDAEIAEAVRLRMVSDVQLGALLSGGIDSTLVLRAMRRAAGRSVKTFAVGFAEESDSELPWAAQAARRYGADHHEEVVRPSAVDLLPKLAAIYDEPFADASALPTYCVLGQARGQVTVLLTGDGGDELFAGYTEYDRFQELGAFDRVPPLLRRVIFGAAAHLWPENHLGKGQLTLLSREGSDRFHEQRAKPAALRFLVPDVRRTILQADPSAFFVDAWRRAPEEPISRLQYVDTKTYLPEDVLVKVDRASMAHSLEVRCPLLDHRVAELAATIPVRFKYAGGEKKLVLKEILRPDLGEAFVRRPKHGFGIPRDRWLRGELAPYVTERLVASRGRLPDGIDRRAVATLLGSYHRGTRDLSRYLWNLLMLTWWMDAAGAPTHG
jgi:asparagine synthase (glutamine-hydrolysing)